MRIIPGATSGRQPSAGRIRHGPTSGDTESMTNPGRKRQEARGPEPPSPPLPHHIFSPRPVPCGPSAGGLGPGGANAEVDCFGADVAPSVDHLPAAAMHVEAVNPLPLPHQLVI